MDDVRFCIIGLGMGRVRAKHVSETEGAKLEAVCDLNKELADKTADEFGCKAFYDVDEMLKDDSIEAVFILTPSGLHLEIGEKAVKAGKHVITTKPMEVTSERSQKFIDICRDAGAVLIVDFERRYWAHLQQWKAAIDAGELGDIVCAEARCKWWRAQSYYDRGGWRGTWKMDGGGSLANQGIHALDELLWLAGDCEVIAAASGVFGHEIETEDFTAALLKLENGNPALLSATTNYHMGDEYGVSVSGTKGSGSDIVNEFRVKFENSDKTELETPVPDWPKNAAQDMVRVLRHGADPHTPGEEGIRSIRLMEEIYKKGGLRG